MTGFAADALAVVNRYVRKAPRKTIPVSVVVVGRNYAPLLRDCLESIDRQEYGAKEVVYVDNASTDESINVARGEGVRVAVVGPQERNICACRNRGALLTREPFLVFLDADDVIPQGYLKQLHDGFTERRVGVVYPRHASIGLYESAGRGGTDPIRKNGGIYRENYIAGQSMVRRRALEAVGGWGKFPVFQDWELWLRIIEHGWWTQFLPKVVYQHRTHASSLTATFQNRMPWYQQVLRERPMTVFTPFGPGRPIRGDKYFKMLNSLGLNWDQTTLFFYDNTRSKATASMLRSYLADCPARNTVYMRDDTKVGYTGLDDRVMVMPERMGEMWTRATPAFQGAFVLSIEDDNEPERPNGCYRLYEGMAPDVAAVCGPYHSRPVVDHNRLLCLEWFTRQDGSLGLREIKKWPGDLPRQPTEGCTQIGATGVGFVLIRRDVLDGFKYPVGRLGNWCGQDFGVWRRVKDRGERLMCHWGVPAKHYYSPTEYT